jgi:hypothetical protein
MDWKRAKTILIVAFILLNIVLSIILYNNIKVEEISQQTINNTISILEQNSVHIECPIPKYKGKDYALQYEEKPLDKKTVATVLLGNDYAKVNDSKYVSSLGTLVFAGDSGFEYKNMSGASVLKSDSKEDIDKYLKTLSKKLGLPFNEFKRDDYYDKSHRQGATRVVYKGDYKDYAVFDNYIYIDVDMNSVKSIKYLYKKPLNISVKNDIYIIPVHEILITKMTEYPGILIKEVDMGFKGWKADEGKTSASIASYEGLCWRIKTDSGQEYYFNARNGEKME